MKLDLVFTGYAAEYLDRFWNRSDRLAEQSAGRREYHLDICDPASVMDAEQLHMDIWGVAWHVCRHQAYGSGGPIAAALSAAQVDLFDGARLARHAATAYDGVPRSQVGARMSPVITYLLGGKLVPLAPAIRPLAAAWADGDMVARAAVRDFLLESDLAPFIGLADISPRACRCLAGHIELICLRPMEDHDLEPWCR
jgi:hypothetical protein